MASTLLYSDGFDAYSGSSSTVGFQNKWASINGFLMSLSATTPFSEGQSIQLTGTGHRIQRSFTATKTPVFRGSFRFDQLATNAQHFLSFLQGSTFQLGFRITTGGAIEVYRSTAQNAGTLLGTSSVCIIATNWHFFEIVGNIDDSSGSVAIYVDGVLVINLTGVDTKNHASLDTVDTVQVGGSTFGGGNFNTFFDNHDMRTGTTSPGKLRIITLRPTADTAQKNFTPNSGSTNYTQIDEALAAVADYVQASNIGDFDLYEFGNMPGAISFSRIDEIVINANALKTDAATRAVAFPVKSGGTTSDGANATLAATAGFVQTAHAADPATGLPWTQAAVDAMQAGIKVTV